MEVADHQKLLSWVFREIVMGVTACCGCGNAEANSACACCRNIHLFFHPVLAGDGRIPCRSCKYHHALESCVRMPQKKYQFSGAQVSYHNVGLLNY